MDRKIAVTLLTGAMLLAVPLSAQKFYPDDPLEADPPPLQTNSPNFRELSDVWDMFETIFGKPGERHPNDGVIPSMGVNTLGEVPDSPWFTNRHAKRRMSLTELKLGAGHSDPPKSGEPWQVLTVKRYDVRPGILIADADNTLYLLRFDPVGYEEMSTGASLVVSDIFHAIGYNVPENYIVEFDRSQLVPSPEGEDINAVGTATKLMDEDISLFLKRVTRDKSTGKYRAVATRAPDGDVLGPFQFFGTRSDDPNDVYPHEHRRDLRGLFVFAAWVDANWIRPSTTLDFLVHENDVDYIRHYLIDFFSSLGSGWLEQKDARDGNEPFFDFGETISNFASFGITAHKWQKAKYPKIRSVGRFEYKTFDPNKWLTNTHMAPFVNRLPGDEYWAAKIVMSFTDEDIRALVSTGDYSDARAAQWIAKCLIERRDKIGRTYFSKVLPLDNFSVEDGELKFEDLEVKYGFLDSRQYTIGWSGFNIFSEKYTPIEGASDFKVPDAVTAAKPGTYFAARISGGEYGKTMDVFLRRETGGIRVVGIDRAWAGRKFTASLLKRKGKNVTSHYVNLTDRQRELFDGYTRQYNERTSFNLKPEEYFESLSVSERTTFDAVTHALSKTELTDAEGNSLGVALDLVAGVERIAGQYYGRQGDEQFRVYVRLKEDAQEKVEKCQQFFRSHENTVYHVGYPQNFRQQGKVPTLQISMAEDGLSADIDVDYRSSKMPSAMWNGHLSSANSDVRAGDNTKRHNNRWNGLVAWWQDVFGDLPGMENKPDTLLLAHVAPEDEIPLPPNRPLGAAIGTVQDATLEFLADWLVHRRYEEALDLVSDECLSCLTLAGNTEGRKANRKTFREVLAESAAKFPHGTSLTPLIESVKPWSTNLREVKHAHEGDYYLAQVNTSVAESFLCKNRSGGFKPKPTGGGPVQFGNYYAVIFRIRRENAEEGAIVLLWGKENGQWRLLSYDIVSE